MASEVVRADANWRLRLVTIAFPFWIDLKKFRAFNVGSGSWVLAMKQSPHAMIKSSQKPAIDHGKGDGGCM